MKPLSINIKQIQDKNKGNIFPLFFTFNNLALFRKDQFLFQLTSSTRNHVPSVFVIVMLFYLM